MPVVVIGILQPLAKSDLNHVATRVTLRIYLEMPRGFIDNFILVIFLILLPVLSHEVCRQHLRVLNNTDSLSVHQIKL